MPPEYENPLPFLTRDMLRFGRSGTFTLIVDVVAHTADPLEIRGYTKDGAFTFTFEPLGDGSIETFSFNLTDVPISVSASISQNASYNSLAHLLIYLGIDSNRMTLLTQGLIGGLFGVAWPQQLQLTDQQLNGAVVDIDGVAPEAGAEVSDTVPANQIWELLGVKLTLTASATVQDRTVSIRVNSGGPNAIVRAAGATQQASEVQSYNCIPGGTTGVISSNVEQEIGLPLRIFLRAADTIATDTTNLHASDQYDTPSYRIRRHYMSNQE